MKRFQNLFYLYLLFVKLKKMQVVLLMESAREATGNLTAYLKMEGYSVVTADNGKKGIEMAEEHLPDLIICDTNLPEMGGYDVLRVLNASPKTSSIPFILSVSDSEKRDLPEVYKLGADNYLVKPYDHETLLETIRIQIRRARSLTLHI
jgi:DNA-binding response OmpR family regulator